MPRAVVLSGVRTPIGRYGGALSGVRPDDLAAVAIEAAVARAGVDPASIDDAFVGCANQAGEDNRNVARMAVLLAGLPESVAGVTVNRLCASGLSAVVSAAHAIMAGDADVVVAGGVESMSRAPLVMAKPDTAFPRGDRTAWDTTLGWRFPNPRHEEMFPLESMGETGENVAERWDVSREDQDAFALRSQERWAAAHAAGRFEDEIVAVGEVAVDEHPRPDTSAEKLAALKPAFRGDGTVTAGNAAGINDGAAALVLASEERARELGIEPLGAFVGSAVAGVDPRVMGIGPVPAVRKLLDRLGVRAGRHRPRRAERGLRLAEPRGRPRARPRRGARERQRRRDRARPPARDERRPPRRLAPARAPPPRRPLRPRDDVRRRRPGRGRAVRALDGLAKTRSRCGRTQTVWPRQKPASSNSSRVWSATISAPLASCSSIFASRPRIVTRTIIASIAPSAGSCRSSRSCGRTSTSPTTFASPTKVMTNSLAGCVVQLARHADLLEAAVVQHGDLVRDLHRLLLVVRDEDRRHVHDVVELPQPLAELGADARVERAERLVEEQHLRLRREGAREAHALALAPGELRRIAVAQALELDEVQELVDALADLVLRPLPHLQAERDVVAHGHVLEGGVVLEDEPDVPLLRRERGRVLSGEEDLARVRGLEPGDDPEQRRLPGAARPEERRQRPALDVERHVVDRDEVAEALRDVANEDGHQAASSSGV